ncbi:transketolase [Marinomonas sp. CT5]|uniref:transketolase n=1 Tax=Marinomonas sp. CT5 TaxID=2066133 RepID=UPI001BB06073|nr:transketolase [Marinomonas sp. CT5]QUX97723.1 transketolase [Marinomonas sp. CT5]
MISFLRKKVNWVWRETLLVHKRAPETRIASSLSAVEIYVALYYGEILKQFPKDPLNEKRDRFIISKGHGSISMYPILADLGFYEMAELERICKPGSFLGAIPDPAIPGYETINGSLGHGLGVACGVATALKAKKSDNKVYVIVGDGELYEGSNWEAIMFAAHHGLDNLIVIVDHNKVSMLDHCERIINHAPLKEKFAAFQWNVTECDGHDIEAVHSSLKTLKETNEGKPHILIAHTLKGRGIPSIENDSLSHIKGVKTEELDQLIRENS